jgi:L-amino acid N-acyltransferase YncA
MNSITLRLVSETDLQKILEWRNEPSTRLQMCNSQIIPLQDHLKYWEKHLKSNGEMSFIVTADGKDVGVARLLPFGDVHEVDIYIAEAARGAGVGKRALAELVKVAKQKGIKNLFARVKPGNPASAQIFETNDFKKTYIYYGLEVL